MKKSVVTFVTVLTLLLVGASVSYAQMGMTGNGLEMMGGSWQNDGNFIGVDESQELKDILAIIFLSQSISSQAEIDCSLVTDDQFDKLGDVYMSIMLPNEQQHEMMDTMMGGEGSASLRQAHINMGRSYLGCWSDYNSGPILMPMMGGFSMMGTGFYEPDIINRFNHNSMMNYGFGGFTGGLFMLLFWILIITGIVTLIRYTMNNKKPSGPSKSALDIIKERYAKGEIEKEEFETKKKDLNI